MEVSVLSEQVDAQSSKIQELENMLKEKKHSFRQMEEALQKVTYEHILLNLNVYGFQCNAILIFFYFKGSVIKKCIRDTKTRAS